MHLAAALIIMVAGGNDDALRSYDLFELWRIERAAEACDLRLDMDAFQHRMMVAGVTWSEVHARPDAGRLQKMDADIAASADRAAYCAAAVREYGVSPDNEWNGVYLRTK